MFLCRHFIVVFLVARVENSIRMGKITNRRRSGIAAELEDDLEGMNMNDDE